MSQFCFVLSIFYMSLFSIDATSSPTRSPTASQINFLNTDASNFQYTAVASSSDGQYIYAVAFTIGVIGSSNYGSTWTTLFSKSSYPWTAIATDATGEYISAGAGYTNNDKSSGYYGYMYYSTNYGQTFTASTIIGDSGAVGFPWSSITIAQSDPSHQYAVCFEDSAGGGLYYSRTYGQIWTYYTAAGAHSFISVATSANGLYVTALRFKSGNVFVSSDGLNSYIYNSVFSNYQQYQCHLMVSIK